MEKKYNLNLIVKWGEDLKPVFDDLQNLKKLGYADKNSLITLNDCTLNAGLYDNYEAFLATYLAVKKGDKEEISKTIPSISQEESEIDFGDISLALYQINKELEKNGFEKFSENEIKDIVVSSLIKGHSNYSK